MRNISYQIELNSVIELIFGSYTFMGLSFVYINFLTIFRKQDKNSMKKISDVLLGILI